MIRFDPEMILLYYYGIDVANRNFKSEVKRSNDLMNATTIIRKSTGRYKLIGTWKFIAALGTETFYYFFQFYLSSPRIHIIIQI